MWVVTDPLGDDLYLWHANFRPSRGCYEGIVFHAEIHFSPKYPHESPSLHFLNHIVHDNIFDGSVCHPLLNNFTKWFQDMEDSLQWKPSFTLQTVLNAILDLLEDSEAITRDKPVEEIADLVRSVEEESNSFVCSHPECKHRGITRIWPELHGPDSPVGLRSLSSMSSFDPEPVFECSVTHKTHEKDTMGIRLTVSLTHSGSVFESVFIDSSYICHSEFLRVYRKHGKENGFILSAREMYTEDSVGPPSTKRRPENVRGIVRYITAPPKPLPLFQPLSPSFSDHKLFRMHHDEEHWTPSYTPVRGERIAIPLSWWIPLYIDAPHWTRAKDTAKNTIAFLRMYENFVRSAFPIEDKPEFNPIDVVQILPLIFRSHVIRMLQDEDCCNEKEVLVLYHLHRVFIALVEEYPAILEECNEHIFRFNAEPSFRRKNHTIDLGRLLVYLSITDVDRSWDFISHAYLSESYVRDVHWILTGKEKVTEKEYLEDLTPERRVDLAWKCNGTGKRYLLVTIEFLRLIRPTGISVRDIAIRYDQTHLHPDSRAIKHLFNRVREIRKLESYDNFYKYLGMVPPIMEEMDKTLILSVELSRKAGYTDPWRVAGRKKGPKGGKHHGRAHGRARGRRVWRPRGYRGGVEEKERKDSCDSPF
jgi:ubiquitin-protein ligase